MAKPISMRALMIEGVLAVVLQLVLSLGVPLFQYFLVFKASSKYMWIMLVHVVASSLPALLGLAAHISKRPLLLAGHVVLTTVVAALLGSFGTHVFLDARTRCGISQVVGLRCAACPCAMTSTCTEDLLLAAPCDTCGALGVDVCAAVNTQTLLMPYTGLICAVSILVPGLFSLVMLTQASKVGQVAAAEGAAADEGREDRNQDGGSWTDKAKGLAQQPEDDWQKGGSTRFGSPRTPIDVEAQEELSEASEGSKSLKRKGSKKRSKTKKAGKEGQGQPSDEEREVQQW